MTRDASACEKHFPPVISGESGRRPPPRRFAPRGRTSPYSPEMTGGSYIYMVQSTFKQPRAVCRKCFMFQLGRDRSRGSSCRAIMPAIDRKCFDRKQTTRRHMASPGVACACVYGSQCNWACTALEHVETKTEEVVFREEDDFLASLAFVVS